MDGEIKRGFAAGTNAADAARKNHQLGTAHQFDTDSGRAAGQKSAERRWGSKDRRKDNRGPDRRQIA